MQNANELQDELQSKALHSANNPVFSFEVIAKPLISAGFLSPSHGVQQS